jgi:hypothetical protein
MADVTPQIEKSGGITPAERYLAQLCEKTFLSLWSYPGVYRDQGKRSDEADGKEICDLLVVFGEHIIIFSDKHCQLKNSGNTALDWQRWFRKAIQRSAEQAWGAERWIRQNPTRIFLDRACKQPFPVDLPLSGKGTFHLVVVAHGVSQRIRAEYSGSGSLLIDTSLKGFPMHTKPFCVGDLDPQKTMVHILDDSSLSILMTARDTISDFTNYLAKREKLLRGPMCVHAPGEEELLAIYLKSMNQQEEHDFVLPINAGQTVSACFIEEGIWEDFQRSAVRIAQIQRDKISYLWDALIETFNEHALKGNQYFVTPGGIKDSEKVLHFMARQPRWKRSALSQALADILRTTTPSKRRLRVFPPFEPGDPHYVFLLFPVPDLPSVSDDQYRDVRRHFLEACCKVAKLKYPDARDIVGIATESGTHKGGRSEDAMYFDARGWNAQMEEEAKGLQEALRILQTPKQLNIHASEYPEVRPITMKLKNYRNKPCPCGSGKKYKKCCGKG